MITFTTESGSTWEVDDAEKQVRRLEGPANTDHRREWRTYAIRRPIEIGKSAVFIWPELSQFEEHPNVTTTSRVTSVFVDGEGT